MEASRDLSSRIRSLLSRSGVAAVLAGLAVLVSLQVAPHWSPRHLLWPFYPAVLLAAWLGGPGPGLFTTILSALVIIPLYLPSMPSLIVQDPADLIGHRGRSEEHTSELQSRLHLVCRLLLEKKKKTLF